VFKENTNSEYFYLIYSGEFKVEKSIKSDYLTNINFCNLKTLFELNKENKAIFENYKERSLSSINPDINNEIRETNNFVPAEILNEKSKMDFFKNSNYYNEIINKPNNNKRKEELDNQKADNREFGNECNILEKIKKFYFKKFLKNQIKKNFINKSSKNQYSTHDSNNLDNYPIKIDKQENIFQKQNNSKASYSSLLNFAKFKKNSNIINKINKDDNSKILIKNISEKINNINLNVFSLQDTEKEEVEEFSLSQSKTLVRFEKGSFAGLENIFEIPIYRYTLRAIGDNNSAFRISYKDLSEIKIQLKQFLKKIFFTQDEIFNKIIIQKERLKRKIELDFKENYLDRYINNFKTINKKNSKLINKNFSNNENALKRKRSSFDLVYSRKNEDNKFLKTNSHNKNNDITEKNILIKYDNKRIENIYLFNNSLDKDNDKRALFSNGIIDCKDKQVNKNNEIDNNSNLNYFPKRPYISNEFNIANDDANCFLLEMIKKESKQRSYENELMKGFQKLGIEDYKNFFNSKKSILMHNNPTQVKNSNQEKIINCNNKFTVNINNNFILENRKKIAPKIISNRSNKAKNLFLNKINNTSNIDKDSYLNSLATTNTIKSFTNNNASRNKNKNFYSNTKSREKETFINTFSNLNEEVRAFDLINPSVMEKSDIIKKNSSKSIIKTMKEKDTKNIIESYADKKNKNLINKISKVNENLTSEYLENMKIEGFDNKYIHGFQTSNSHYSNNTDLFDFNMHISDCEDIFSNTIKKKEFFITKNNSKNQYTETSFRLKSSYLDYSNINHNKTEKKPVYVNDYITRRAKMNIMKNIPYKSGFYNIPLIGLNY